MPAASVLRGASFVLGILFVTGDRVKILTQGLGATKAAGGVNERTPNNARNVVVAVVHCGSLRMATCGRGRMADSRPGWDIGSCLSKDRSGLVYAFRIFAMIIDRSRAASDRVRPILFA